MIQSAYILIDTNELLQKLEGVTPFSGELRFVLLA